MLMDQVPRFTVLLRNGKSAMVCRLTGGVGSFPWRRMASGLSRQVEPGSVLGSVSSDVYPCADLWREDGRWREDGQEHPLDIVAGINGELQ